VRTPPLRERTEDLLFLCTRFLREACAEFGKQIEGFSDEALDQIVSCPWPGNVRELKSVIRRAALVNTGRIEYVFKRHSSHTSARVSTAQLGGSIVVCAETVIGKDAIRQRHVPLKDIRRQLIHKINQAILDVVLRQADGNKSDAARILELDYKTVLALHKGTANGKEDVPPKNCVGGSETGREEEGRE